MNFYWENLIVGIKIIIKTLIPFYIVAVLKKDVKRPLQSNYLLSN